MTSLTPEEIDDALLRIHDRGYVVLENVIPRNEVEAARDEYRRLFDEFRPTGSSRPPACLRQVGEGLTQCPPATAAPGSSYT